MSDIIEKCRKFLSDSHSFYSNQVTRMNADLERYSDDTFWDKTLIEEFDRADRPRITWNLWSLFVNAISSPYSASPFHVELENKTDQQYKDIQEAIDGFESNEDSKNKINEWLANTAITGQGFATISIIDKPDDTQEICLELIDDPNMVAFDPAVNTRSGEDAEMGAIINMVDIARAKRLYGEDIVGYDYPHTLPPLASIGSWKSSESTIAVINFYFKNAAGKVMFAKLCGNKVIGEVKEMPYSIIPIMRMTGYKVLAADRKKDYIGVVRKTLGLQLGANVGYSTLLERMNRSPKGNFLMPVGAIEGLEKYYQIAGKKQSLLYLYNGTVAPTPIKESFETADLAETVEKSIELMSSVLGIPVTGVNGINFTEKTATQVLVQQTNSQSNVSCFYSSAYMAIRMLGRILIQLFGGDENAVFSLQNGPDVITTNSKKRQELSLMATLLPENMKPVIAYHMSKTFDDSVGKDLSSDILANMDPNIKIVSDSEMDPNAVHIMNGMKQTLDQTMQQLTLAKQQSVEQQKQIDSLTLQLTNMKAQQQLDWQKFLIQHQDDVRLKEASLMLNGKTIDNKEKADSQKAMIDGEKVALDAQKEKNRVMENIQQDIDNLGGTLNEI